MENENNERAQNERLMRELDDASYALYKLRPTVSVTVPVRSRMARVQVYRVKPRSPEVLQEVFRDLECIERNFAAELALPVTGWRATLSNWWYRKRLKLLSQRADRLLQLVTGEQALLITYHDIRPLPCRPSR